MEEKCNEAAIISWLEESDRSEGGLCFSSNSEIDGLSEHDEDNTKTEKSSDEESHSTNEQEAEEPMIIDDPCRPLPSAPSQLQSNANLYYVGKDPFCKWLIHKPVGARQSKTRKQNVVTKLPGVNRDARNCQTIVDCWKLIFPDKTIEDIVKYTNTQLDSIRDKYSRERNCLPTSYEEMLGFFGILYMLVIKKASHLNTAEV